MVLYLNHLSSLHFASIIFEWAGTAFCQAIPKTGKEIVLQTRYEKLAATINISKAQGCDLTYLSTSNNLTQILP